MLCVQAVRKAWANAAATRGPQMPLLFQPPPGGSSYFGRGYRWQQVMHYKYWSFVALKAWVREIAGGEHPLIGRVTRKTSVHKVPVRKALGGPKQHHIYVPYDDDHPLVQLFERPNDSDVAYDMWAYHTVFFGLCGSSHWWVRRNGFQIPKQIWVIPTHWMQLEVDGAGMPYRYYVQSPWGQAMYIPYDEVVSFYEHSPLEPRYGGWAVSQAVAEWIDSYESLIRMRLAVWKNGAVPSFHVMLGESYADPDEQYLARFYAKWFARFQGEDKSGLPLVTGADVQVKSIEGHRPADALAASNASETQIRDQTLAAYGVPRAIVGLTENGTWSGVEAEKDAFRQFSVNSLLTYMGQVLTQKVVRTTPGCEDGVLYWEDRCTGDADYRLREEEQHLKLGVTTVEEIRTKHGLEPYPNGGRNPFVEGTEMPWVDAGEAKSNPPLGREPDPLTPAPVDDELAPKSLRKRKRSGDNDEVVLRAPDGRYVESYNETAWAFVFTKARFDAMRFTRADADRVARMDSRFSRHGLRTETLTFKAMGESNGSAGGYLVNGRH